MAEKKGCAIGQLLQSWAVQRGTIPLGRSSNPERVASNFAVMRLSDNEKQDLDALNGGEKGRTVNPD
jgi:glycerol 2-dehydrogenase (NADP+)